MMGMVGDAGVITPVPPVANFAAYRLPYLLGSGQRMRARALALAGRTAASRAAFAQALELLRASPNRWETALACVDAGIALPEQRAASFAEARALFEALGFPVELRRLESLEQRA